MIGPLITLVRNEARRILFFRWLVVATTVLLWCAAAVYIQRLPSTYDAWGQIYVAQQTPLSAAAEGVSLVGAGYGSPHVVQTTLLNDDNLEKIVRRIDPRAASKGDAALAAAVNRLRGKIHRAPDPGDGFIELHVTDTDPVRARDVVRLLMEQFISSNIGRSQRDLGRAGEFLDEQITGYGAMLQTSQANIAAFRRSHPQVALVALPAGRAGDGPSGSYDAPSGEPLRADARDAPAPAPSPAAQRVAELEARLALLRTTYTERYPDVVATRRQLADAVVARDHDRSVAAADAASRPAVASRLRDSRTGPRRSAPHSLAARPPPPEVAAAWTELQKADELLRVNYQQLLAKKAATQMSQAVYRDDEAGKYQIVRQPTVPLIPTGPDRRLYLGVAFLFSIGAGVAAGYLRAAMKGILVSRRELEEIFQLPVIGTVSWEPAWHTSRPPQGWLARGVSALPRWPRTRHSP